MLPLDQTPCRRPGGLAAGSTNIKLTQATLAQRMGIMQSQITVIEAQDARATVMTLYKAL